MGELIDMAAQFRGLPMGDLIGAPLQAACDAQTQLARSTASFIKSVGFLPAPKKEDGSVDPDAVGDVRIAPFKFTRPAPHPTDPTQTVMETVELDVPMLAIVKVPSLAITSVDITFDMEVKSSFKEAESEDTHGGFSADAEVGWGPFSMKVHVEGSVSTHKEQTRTSDSSAKYHVEVKAMDTGMPEGLARVLDIMHSAVVPTVTKRQERPAVPAPVPAAA
ncbi:hypothetical protein GCM10009422_13240 [Brevundimonas kwangchunensis]|uniref:DUF2589 domain-containing protein n=1 Tax=Brevundimonas kwangchunensis TaxID=322163 RepID=A0ABN1GTH7_9CAUL